MVRKFSSGFPVIILFLFSCLLCFNDAIAQQFGSTYSTTPQGTPVTLANAPQRDTTKSKTNTNQWRDQPIQMSIRTAYSQQEIELDTQIHTIHRRPFSQPWYRDLGNQGSPSRSLLFTTVDPTGPSLGYHVFDVYRFNVDSLLYYNTTRPYSDFAYRLGSHQEQTASILHTQNIMPNWNFAVQYRKIFSPGYYKIQRTSHDNANASTNYQSKNQRYQLFAGFVYNKEQNDENAGILSDSFLSDPTYQNRLTIPVRFENDAYSSRRSSVTNTFRDYSILVNHSYLFGQTDTTYNQDSSQYSLHLRPRFGLSHRMEITSQKYTFKDLRPDSLRYVSFPNQTTFESVDSVFTQQKWVKFDNSFALNGFFGPAANPLKFSAGYGIRYDRFLTNTGVSTTENAILSNYLIGEIKKEALKSGEWHYRANAQFFFTGDAAGNFEALGELGKDLGAKAGNVTVGFKQQLTNAPYNFTLYKTRYNTIQNDFGKENISQIYGYYNNNKWMFAAGVRTYIIGNYIYMNEQERPAQFTGVFNLSEAWIRKAFRFGIVVLDNELAVQKATPNAPVNVPVLLGRHQLAIETSLFKKALKIASGVEARYTTNYYADGYSPFFNRFYYQNTYKVANNVPELSIFFNFKVKRFRCYVMVDQFNQLPWDNYIITKGYAAQDLMFRFGFDWALID